MTKAAMTQTLEPGQASLSEILASYVAASA
jgi:hypothetical protein